MGHSRIRHYYHVVWSPKYRLPLLLPTIEGQIFRWIEEEFTKHKCRVLRINGMPDHLHVIVEIPGTLKTSTVYGHVKSKVSDLINSNGLLPIGFAWQVGVSSDTVSRRSLSAAIKYVERQKAHHATLTFDEEWVHLFLEGGTPLDPWTKGWERIPENVQQLLQRGIHPIGLHKTQIDHLLQTTDAAGVPLPGCPPHERLPSSGLHTLLQHPPSIND